MDTRKVALEYRLAQWAQIIGTRAQSGQSIKDFCSSEGISKNAFYYWQRKLREAACSELAQVETVAEKGLIPSGWARLEAKESATKEPASTEAGVTIEVGGCRITATAETDPELLANVCRMLRSL